MSLSKLEKSFSALFFVIVLIELFSATLSSLSSFHNVAKPLIVVCLIAFLYVAGNHLSLKTRRTMLLALLFSLIGDVVIMFDHLSSAYFIGGLIAFLVSHILYILVFLKKRNPDQKPVIFIAVLLIYSVGLFYVLKDGLDSMLIPVICYMVVIFAMAITASLRKQMVSNLSYNLVLIGALLFLISDSFLAVNKFNTEIPYEHIIIMGTYALAQYCIVLGVLKQKD